MLERLLSRENQVQLWMLLLHKQRQLQVLTSVVYLETWVYSLVGSTCQLITVKCAIVIAAFFISDLSILFKSVLVTLVAQDHDKLGPKIVGNLNNF